MSLKQVCISVISEHNHADTVINKEIETWVQALEAYDNQEFEESLRCFYMISDTSKILFNCGVIYATLGDHHKAVSDPMRGFPDSN